MEVDSAKLDDFCKAHRLLTPVINTGNPEEYTIKELAERVIAALPEHAGKIEYHPLPQDDPKRRKPDITLASELLGWKPVVPLAIGLGKTIDYFRGKAAEF